MLYNIRQKNKISMTMSIGQGRAGSRGQGKAGQGMTGHFLDTWYFYKTDTGNYIIF